MDINRVPVILLEFLFLSTVLLSTVKSAGADPSGPALALASKTDAFQHWWPGGVDQALERARQNRPQLLAALRAVPQNQRDGLVFLLENMPDSDLQMLSSQFLLENLALAYQAVERAPWKESLPRQVFLNEVVPYASLNEARDNSRRLLQEKALPFIAGCKTTSEAAERLNEKLFPLLNVRYSTERERPDQSPSQTIASGKASCSGLAILLVDACRAVGVPARVAGTPLWANGRGNHTWVEIWDGGWHFTGAAEPDPNGLDRGWFTHDAAQAIQGDSEHAIYASSFEKTGLSFPLVWAPQINWVSAVDVTKRYAASPAAPVGTTRVLIQVLNQQGQRIAAPLVIQDVESGKVAFQGASKGETADLNDMLAFDAVPDHFYHLGVEVSGKMISGQFKTGAEKEQRIAIDLRQVAAQAPASRPPFYVPAPQPPGQPLPSRTAARLKKALDGYFAASPEAQAAWTFAPELNHLLRTNERAVRQFAWEAFRAAPIHGALRADFDSHQVRFQKYLSPYTLKTVGTRPPGGWPLFIALHGGGGAPKEVNDSQWQMMQIYYKDHPELGGYRYLALRAPNDTWNGFYDDYVYPLIVNLIRQELLFNDVDSNKVFIMGYSHGGYGAFTIGPKMPDRFAAVHVSAAAPTDGETSARTLRNTPFSVMVGSNDNMYGRLERDRKFAAQIQALRRERTDIYPVTVDVKEGYGHGGLPDRDEIVEMYAETRNPVPRELTWEMTDSVISDFFWLDTGAPGKGREINAVCRNNRITLTTSKVSSAGILLDSRLIDFQKPVTLEVNGKKSAVRVTPGLKILCETLIRRGDPDLAFTAAIALSLPAAIADSTTFPGSKQSGQ